ncbi:type I polyketide synthase [Desulfoluna sp.]|uniref:type I polyketide synthase n=1 Tax=Desulfoluna sp. TaxID=2045199 RepID=UPI00260F6796|nr:type I polyketide synthase [Desulfoluna sp.]
MKEWNPCSLMTVTPFECPDEQLAHALHRAGAFSVLDIGHQPERGKEALKRLSKKISGEFGIRIPDGVHLSRDEIPENVGVIMLSDSRKISLYPGKKIAVQASTLESAVRAENAGAWAVIAKGSESGGEIQVMSSFVLFQSLKASLTVPVFVQGGCGLHTAAAVLALGGAGVVFDSQLSLLRESRVPDSLKEIIKRLDGTETKVWSGHRILSRPGALDPCDGDSADDIISRYGGLDVARHYIPMGQDVAFAKTIYDRYKSAESFVFSVKESIYAHIRQARHLNPLGAGSLFAGEHHLAYPIAQGPMSSISENPEFADSIAQKGGLPFIALSTFTGEQAAELLEGTATLLGEKRWGVGLLGFLPNEIFSEQLGHIFKAKPHYALIAGGRPSQAESLERAGVQTFLHVPTPGLLDLFLKEGARKFVFEGRECGGHIGPLSSFVLWEQQIDRLMKRDRLDDVSLLFAGGIHDACSSAMLAVMTAPLVARGARVGLLMGTSYLYTEEAVKTGALLKTYQQKAINKKATRILSTAPGHEIRCLASRYVDYFESVKATLTEEGGKGEMVWTALEQMNMGRLRIAAQGMTWVGDSNLSVDERFQAEQGLYMIGQVASLRTGTTTVEALHQEVSEGAARIVTALDVPPYPKKQGLQVDIAIIGASSVFPESPDHASYWKHILTAKNLISEVPDSRWNKALYYDPEAKKPELGLAGKKTNTKWGGFLPECYFDPIDYGIPPQSLAAIDPVQLLSLHVSAGALADAGYKDLDFDRENTSVIFGVEAGTDLAGAYGLRNIFPQYFGDIPPELDAVLPTLTEDSFPGVLGNVISGRIANRLDLGGRNYTVDAACASSMAAIDSGCRELASGGSNLVIAGGADSHNSINDYLMFSSLYTLSSGGESKPFDAETDGLCMGEGVAAVVLKRYEDAVQDGDRIYAVIKGIGGSSDGRSLGLTAPRKEGQAKAVTRAYAQAGISAAEVGLIEAHGTGTIVGDKTELSSLTETFVNAGAAKGTCALGTVKSQIGHTKCASGMAGIIKVMLSLYHGVLPPTINLHQTNSFYDPKTSPFVFSSMARPWLAKDRIAGVSAFGFGGTNFHVVLKNCTEQQPPVPFTSLEDWPAELILIRGLDAEEARQTIRGIRDFLTLRPNARLRDLAYSLVLKKEPVYAAIVAESREDLLASLAAVQDGRDHPDVHYVKPVDGKVAFLFAGQGSQYPGMLSDLFVTFPFLKDFLVFVEALVPLLYPADAFSPDEKARARDAVKETVHAQQLIGVVSLAMAALLKKLGIEPDMLGGHSYGEIPALCYSGAIDINDVAVVSKHRAEAILRSVESDPGKMAAVLGGEEARDACIKDIAGVVVANYNSPTQSVISGASDAVDMALTYLKKQGVTAREIPVACAFHSPLIYKAQAEFLSYLKGVPLQTPSLPVWSNTTAEPYPVSPEKIRERLSEHLVKPVRFADQITSMEKEGATVFIEIGPGAVLTGLVQDTAGGQHRAFCTDKKGENGIRRLMTVLAQYLSTGRSFDLETLFEGRGAIVFDLNSPESYTLNSTVWAVNGHRSVPVVGDLPDTAMRPVEVPLKLSGFSSSGTLTSGDNRDETVKGYLHNVKEIMQAQRDVMLGYLGAPALEPLSAPAPGRGEGASKSVERPVQDRLPETKPVKELLLEIIADKTGYPIEMLDLNLDLEADLSIDSIKRIEILGELNARLALVPGEDENSEADENPEEIMEALAAIKTLQGIIDWLHDKVAGGDSDSDIQTQDSQSPLALTRYKAVLARAPEPMMNGYDISGQSFALTKDSLGVVDRLSEALKEKGADVHVVTLPDDSGLLGDMDGLIYLSPLSEKEGRGPATDLFDLVKQTNPDKIKWLYGVTGLGGDFGEASAVRASLAQYRGEAGFIKSLSKEWHQTRCRYIDVSPHEPPERLTDHIVDEMFVDDVICEVGYANGLRQLYNIHSNPLATEGEGDILLDSDSVILALGGGKGITASVVLELADRYGCTLILVGRSERPGLQESADFSGIFSDVELRKAIIARGDCQKPADIESKLKAIRSERQLRDTLRAIGEKGGRYEYVSMDVTDKKAFSELIDDIYKAHGRIDGVLHGAGVIDDKYLHQKSKESFENVFATKTVPAQVLCECLHEDVQFVSFFSSIASAFGNKGQVDYSSANDTLDKLAMDINLRIKGRAFSINWGPWAGQGMVSEALSREYEKAGIGLIASQEGTKALLDEIRYGKKEDARVILMCGSPESMLLQGGLVNE